jgi:hypothetical protein
VIACLILTSVLAQDTPTDHLGYAALRAYTSIYQTGRLFDNMYILNTL